MNRKEVQQQLFMAIVFSNLKDLEKAYSNGADINGCNMDGNTPLTEAILGGMGVPGAVRELLRLGADPSLKDGNGWTPWMACLSRLHDRVVEDKQKKIQRLLYEYGATTKGDDIVHLWRHALNGDLEQARKLLEEGVSPNSELVCTLGVAVLSGNTELVDLLLDHGAYVDGSNPKDHSHLTPLIHAANRGDIEMTKLLVSHGADVGYEIHEDDERRTAVSYAAEKGHQKIVSFLRNILEKKA